MTCLGMWVIHVDESGLKMPCTTLKGRRAAILPQGVHNSWKYPLFGFFCSCSSLEVGAQCQGKILPGDLLGQICASCLGVDLVLASGFL